MRDNSKYLKRIWKMDQMSLPTEGTINQTKSIEKEKPMLGAIGMAVNYSI